MFKSLLQRMGVLPSDKELSPEELAKLPDAKPGERPQMAEDMAAYRESAESEHQRNADDDDFDYDADDILDDDDDYETDEIDDDLLPSQRGNAHTRPKDLEEAKARYSFIETIYRKAGVEDQEELDNAVMGYANYRRRNRLAYYTEGQVEGWRFAALEQKNRSVVFHGVTDDGLIKTGEFSASSYPMDEGRPKSEFDWSFSDPLAATRQLAKAAEKGETPAGLYQTLYDKTPLIIQSANFDRLMKSKRERISAAVQINPPSWDWDARFALRKATTKISYTAGQDEKRRFGAMTNALMRSLDPEIQKTVRSTATYSIDYANWLGGENEGKRDETLARNRQRAVANYPIFAKTMFESSRLRENIDEARPLNAALASNLGVSAEILPRLKGLTWQKAGRSNFHDPSRLINMVNMIDRNHVPTTRKGFAGLEVATEAACHVSLASNRASPEQLLEGVGGRFEKIAELAQNNPAGGIRDMARDLRQRLVGPAIVQTAQKLGADEKESFSIADGFRDEFGPLEGLSVRGAMESSVRWHRNETTYKSELDDPEVTGDTPWKTIVDEIDLGKGYRAVEHRSTADLQRAGDKHGNCVGGYTDEVLEAESLIFAIYKDDEMVSNVEFVNFRNGVEKTDPETNKTTIQRNVAIQQDLGMRNETPPKASLAASQVLRKHLNTLPPEKWDEYKQGLCEAQDARDRKQNAGRISRQAGFHADDRGKLEKAWECYKPLLPKTERKKGLDGWIKDHIEPEVKKQLHVEDRRHAKRLLSALQSDDR